MDKETILEKSRQENRPQDEMERTISVEGEAFSVIVTMLAGLLILGLKFSRGLPMGDTLAMFWATAFGSELYQACKRRKKHQAALAVFSLAMMVYNLVKYVCLSW